MYCRNRQLFEKHVAAIFYQRQIILIRFYNVINLTFINIFVPTIGTKYMNITFLILAIRQLNLQVFVDSNHFEHNILYQCLTLHIDFNNPNFYKCFNITMMFSELNHLVGWITLRSAINGL